MRSQLNLERIELNQLMDIGSSRVIGIKLSRILCWTVATSNLVLSQVEDVTDMPISAGCATASALPLVVGENASPAYPLMSPDSPLISPVVFPAERSGSRA